ncbi:hypothetical protein VTK73DRAFT_8431 [Phialemonium thermophilum]|uniref:RRM domain-containing protein n=1 Tax=Phialemonium thermophilum TaxID=223376 RepID=A0ABR3XNN5_9PEZI
MSRHWEQNKDATVYVGNIDERFTQELLSELMTQVGPVRQVHMPQDRVSQTHQGYGFVEFDTPQSADYAAKVLNGIRVWGKPIRVNKASADKQKAVDIGAELFINNLDPQVDEKILYDTFSQFGQILRQPNVVRDDNNISKGYGFVSFDSFEASDAAREAMNGQYLLSRAITVEYAYKKDGKGERHGDEAERKLAAEAKKHNIVPEQQPLPPAFHMTRPTATATAATPPHVNGAPGAIPPVAPAAAAATPPVVPPVAPVSPAGFVPPVGPPGAPPRGLPTPGFNPGPVPVGAPMGRGGPVLAPLPTGLPARPPPSHVGYGGPVPDFRQGPPGAGFRGGPSPVPGGPSPVYPGIPPPAGFPGAPPAVAPPGIPPGAPPGFTPPPGFGPPPGVPPPPNGFAHR